MLKTKIILLVVILLQLRGNQPEAAPTTDAVSPDGRVRIEVALRKVDGTENVPHYRVTYNNLELIQSSRFGVELEDGTSIGGPCEIVQVERRLVDDQFTQVTGKRKNVRVQANEVVVKFRELQPPKRSWELALRATDDGVAFRYRFPNQPGWDALAIRQEKTTFQVDAKACAFALPLGGYTTSYEKRYKIGPVSELPTTSLLGLPLLFEAPTGTWFAITEANVSEYAGLYLAPTEPGILAARLSPLPDEPHLAVRHPLPHSSPWRVILLGSRIGQFIESDLILSLNDACAIPDPSWIKTGKTTFPWWNGFHEEQLSFPVGLNTATAKYYIDFCAESGIPYHSLDGMGDEAWYGGPIVPYQGADITRGKEGLDLPEVLEHARSKGVRLRLWMHWKAAEMHMKTAFPKYREWGIEGVMLDFMDRDDQPMNRFVREVCAWAAENQLTVTLHGCPKPTGLERTYPNLLTHEGVMNLEYNKWDAVGIQPEHEVTVPFTRMLAGPLDFHQGSFRTVKLADFVPRNVAPLVMGTPARTLASYVVYQNHLSMIADYPSAYRNHPALPALVAIPTTWDDTRVLEASVGEFIVLARRAGSTWHVGAMTDRQSRSINVPLAFLNEGAYRVTIWQDDSGRAGFLKQEQNLTATDTLQLQLSSGGGAYVRIEPR